jgi:hypothetical protein
MPKGRGYMGITYEPWMDGLSGPDIEVLSLCRRYCGADRPYYCNDVGCQNWKRMVRVMDRRGVHGKTHTYRETGRIDG